jgi:hypothetical protein
LKSGGLDYTGFSDLRYRGDRSRGNYPEQIRPGFVSNVTYNKLNLLILFIICNRKLKTENIKQYKTDGKKGWKKGRERKILGKNVIFFMP